MAKYEGLKEMIQAELERIQKKGELTASTLPQAESLAHTLKCLESVEKEEQRKSGGYSEGYAEHFSPMFPYRYGLGYDGGSYGLGPYEMGSYEGGSYGPGRGRGSNARRDSMGRYASENRRGGSYDEGESMESYRNR